MTTALTITNTDKVSAFNFVYFKGIYEHCSLTPINMHLVVIYIEINHTKKELKVNDKVLKLIENTEYTYKLKKRSKHLLVVSSGNFEKFLTDAKKQSGIFHHRVFDLLQKIAL